MRPFNATMLTFIFLEIFVTDYTLWFFFVIFSFAAKGFLKFMIQTILRNDSTGKMGNFFFIFLTEILLEIHVYIYKEEMRK